MSVRVRPCPPLRKVFGKASEGCGWVDNWIVWPVFCPDSPIGRGLRLRTATVRVRISLGALEVKRYILTKHGQDLVKILILLELVDSGFEKATIVVTPYGIITH